MSTRPLQSLSLRQAIIERLRADTDLTAIVPAERVFGMRSPAVLTWPFVRYGVPDESSIRKGTRVRVTLHAFSKAQFEDQASNIIAALQASLEDAVVDLDGGLKAYMVWLGSQIMGDGAEADAWHGIASFTATIG